MLLCFELRSSVLLLSSVGWILQDKVLRSRLLSLGIVLWRNYSLTKVSFAGWRDTVFPFSYRHVSTRIHESVWSSRPGYQSAGTICFVWTFVDQFLSVSPLLQAYITQEMIMIPWIFWSKMLTLCTNHLPTQSFYNDMTFRGISFGVSVHRGLMNKIPTRCRKSSLFFFVFCSTCFGRYSHPSSGASTVQAGMV
jgi:hypothetical protein